MDIAEIRRNRLQLLKGDRKNREIADTLGMSDSQISQILGKKKIGDALARRIESAFHKPRGWMDQAVTEDDRVRHGIGDFVAESATRYSSSHPPRSEPSSQSPGDAQDKYQYVNRVRGGILSAGDGRFVFEFEEIDKSHAFRADWMREKGLRPDQCKLFQVEGDSMSPYLQDGDIALADTSDVRIKSGDVYALVVGDEWLIKRLYWTAEGLLVCPDNQNPQYRSFTIPENTADSVQIIGKIKWRGG